MRVDPRAAMPEVFQAMMSFQRVVDGSGLDPRLLQLVNVRASQINRCAHCLDVHARDAIAIGEDPKRLNVLAAWREAPFFDLRERAALAWCESLTLLAESGAPDDVFEELQGQFSAPELVALTAAIVAINGWNRIVVGLRPPLGAQAGPQHGAAIAARR